MSTSNRALVMFGLYFTLNIPDLVSVTIYVKIELYLLKRNKTVESIEMPELPDQPYGGIYVGDQACNDDDPQQTPQHHPVSGWYFTVH